MLVNTESYVVLLPYLFVLLFVIVIYGLFLYHRFISFLKENHFDKWKELGAPTLLMNNSIKNNFAIWKFLSSKEYELLRDQELIKKSLFLWNYQRISLITCALILFLFLFMIMFAK